MPWTSQQEAILTAVSGTSSHLLIEALAGTGKTTTCVEAARAAPPGTSCAMLAFNRHIAAELQERLAGAAKACTLHSLGLASCRRAWGGVTVDEKKPEALLRKARPSWFWEGKRGGVQAGDEARAVLALARLCKYTLTDPGDPDALGGLIEHFDVQTPPRRRMGVADLDATLSAAECEIDIDLEARRIVPFHPERLAPEVLAHLVDLYDDVVSLKLGEAHALGPHVAELLAACAAERHVVDYDDMVWLPVVHKLAVGRYGLLLVDEAQDLNRCQQALAALAAPDGRICPVGDQRQSLYSFAGADPEALPRLGRQLGESPAGCVSLPLTITWRCPQSHVALAKQLVPELMAAPSAIDGDLIQRDPDAPLHLTRPGDLVLARRNAPLLKLAFALAANSVPVLVRGRDIGQGLASLVESLQPSSVEELLGKLSDWADRERERLERRGAPDSSFEALTDKEACLVELASRSPSVQALLDQLRAVFGDDPGGEQGRSKVVLSSIHRAKGLEADRVFLIDTGSIPLVRSCRDCQGSGVLGGWDVANEFRGARMAPPACLRCKGRGTNTREWERQTELNLAYVAVTRAKQCLVICGPMPTCFGGF